MCARSKSSTAIVMVADTEYQWQWWWRQLWWWCWWYMMTAAKVCNTRTTREGTPKAIAVSSLGIKAPTSNRGAQIPPIEEHKSLCWIPSDNSHFKKWFVYYFIHKRCPCIREPGENGERGHSETFWTLVRKSIISAKLSDLNPPGIMVIRDVGSWMAAPRCSFSRISRPCRSFIRVESYLGCFFSLLNSSLS